MSDKAKLKIVPDLNPKETKDKKVDKEAAENEGYESVGLSGETDALIGALVRSMVEDVGREQYDKIAIRLQEFLVDEFKKAGIEFHAHYAAALSLHVGATCMVSVMVKRR